MGELQYAKTSGATRIFFYVQTFIGNRTNGEESFDSYPPFTFVWVQQTVRSSYWSCHRKGISLEPTNKRFNSAYLQNEFVISRIFLSDTFGLSATFTC